TEELIEWILNDYHPVSDGRKSAGELRILDIGTGSGCIPIVLKKHLPDAGILALDFSEKALNTARNNADYQQTEIQFIQADFLNMDFAGLPEFDIIVSNPPYIAENERPKM